MSSDSIQDLQEFLQKAMKELEDYSRNKTGDNEDKKNGEEVLPPEFKVWASKLMKNGQDMAEAVRNVSEQAEHVENKSESENKESEEEKEFVPQFIFGADLRKAVQEREQAEQKTAKNHDSEENDSNAAGSYLVEDGEEAHTESDQDAETEKTTPIANGNDNPDFTSYPLEKLFADDQKEDKECASVKLEEVMTPRQVVEALDRYIVGQDRAKKAVAVALRNRYRREKLGGELREEIIPKNILMVGPTGVGKTEIARRLAKLVGAPFLKVEATKYTEVGYVGRDVESMIRDLALVGMRMVERERLEKVKREARLAALERLLDSLQGVENGIAGARQGSIFGVFNDRTAKKSKKPVNELAKISRSELYERLFKGELKDHTVEIEIEEDTPQEIQVLTGDSEEIGVNFQDIFGSMFPKKRQTHKLPVDKAFKLLIAEESKKLIDMEDVKREAVELIENQAIVFLDELDKVAGKEGGGGHGPDVSREGVQRDILPIVEGCSVNTKIGPIRTEHILFIAAGAFHETKPSDLIPELQGRFPIRVTLDSLKKEDFKRILTEPQNSLTRQYKELLSTEGIEVEFGDDAIDELAAMACQVNEQNENIGARRLHTLLERVLEKISFEAPEMDKGKVVIDRQYVLKELNDICQSRDLSRFIL